MKLINTIRTLALAAVAALVGTSAWAELSIPTGNAAEAGGTLNYVITSADELAQLKDIFDNVWNYKTVNVKIANDIDFTGKQYRLPYIGGQGSDNRGTDLKVKIYADVLVTIKGLQYADTGTGDVGLVEHVAASTDSVIIENITLENVEFTTGKASVANGVGAFVGFMEGTELEFVNCHVKGSSIGGAKYVGGMVGYCHANANGSPLGSLTFQGCSVTGVTFGSGRTGGFIGYTLAHPVTVNNCDSSENTYTSSEGYSSIFWRLNGSGGVGTATPTNVTTDFNADGNKKYAYDIQTGNGAVLIVEETAATPVAQVGTTKYTNLMEAIDAAYDGGTVELLADVTINRWHQNVWSVEDRDDLTYSGNRAVTGCNGLTINGNGHTLTINGIDSGTNGDQLFSRSRNLTISDLTINAASGVKGIGLVSGTISGVTFNMGGQPAVYTSGINDHAEGEHIEIRNCVFNSNGDVYGIYNASLPNDGAEALASGAIVSGNTFNTYRSVALRSDMQFLNNKVNGAKGVTVGGDATAVVVRGNIFADTNTSRSINVYPSNATIENNVILGPIELEDNKTYETAPDLSGNYWGGDAPANLPEGVVVNSYYTMYTGYASPAQDGSLFELSNLVSLLTDEVKVDVVPADVITTVVDANGNEVENPSETQTAAVAERKTAAADAIAANTPAAEKTGTGIKTVDESAYLKIALEKAVVEVSENDASLKTLVFDVQPMKVVGSVETKIQNSEITKPITFRLPLTDDFTISALITHAGDDDRVVPVQGTSGQKYVELTFTHFSEVTATPTDKVESSIASTEQLGIIRYAPTDLYKHTLEEVAVGVPWLSTSSTSESDVAVTVAELIATGLTSGDQISVWDKANKRYDVWQWNGSAWVAALDADSNSTTTKSAYTTKVERGQAFWYKRNDTTKTFALIGRPKDNATTTPEAGASKNPKYNLMSNPYPDAIDLAELAGTEGDQIVTIPDGTFYTYTTAKGGWCTREWVEDTSVTLPWLPGNQHPVSERIVKQDSLVIPSGRSFWYISKGGTPEINWKSLKKVTE